MTVGKLKPNKNFEGLNKNYLFTEIKKRVNEFKGKSGREVISLGVGDVAYPLPPSAVRAMVDAVQELGDNARFRGYPEENGYGFLKSAIVKYYLSMGVEISEDEVYIGEGAKSDASCFLDVFNKPAVAIPSPVYPVYSDSAIMGGYKIEYINCTKQNGFKPLPTGLDSTPHAVWLCSPNNPTGVTLSYSDVEQWVDYAIKTGSLILYDSAYSAFIAGNAPRSVFEIAAAKSCAVEFGSFSKMAGFTNLRLSWVIIPKELNACGASVGGLWKRRQSAKFNGVSYPVQRAGEAVLSPVGQAECKEVICKYMATTREIRAFLQSKGVWCVGGENSPYVWMECLHGMTSWEFFDFLLYNAGVVGTPGVGFGQSGEGFFRLSGFTSPTLVRAALDRMERCF